MSHKCHINNDNDSNDDTDKTTKTVLMMSNTRRILMITMEAKVSDSSYLHLSRARSLECCKNQHKSTSRLYSTNLQKHKLSNLFQVATQQLLDVLGIFLCGIVSWSNQEAQKFNLSKNLWEYFGISESKNSLNCKIMICSI